MHLLYHAKFVLNTALNLKPFFWTKKKTRLSWDFKTRDIPVLCVAQSVAHIPHLPVTHSHTLITGDLCHLLPPVKVAKICKVQKWQHTDTHSHMHIFNIWYLRTN